MDEQATLLIRPDILNEQPASPGSVYDSSEEIAPAPFPLSNTVEQPQTKERSDSNPLLDKYPVLRFHNLDVADSGPGSSAALNSTDDPMGFDELDKLIKDLQQS